MRIQVTGENAPSVVVDGRRGFVVEARVGPVSSVNGRGGAVTGLAEAADVPHLDVANVRDYGAVGDGTTDDTAAIQAAINASTLVYLPPGYTFAAADLTPRAGTVIVGGGAAGFSYTAPAPDAMVATLKLKDGANTNLITGADGITQVQLRNLKLDGNKTNNSSGDLIHLDAATAHDTAWHIVDCTLDNSPHDGIYIGSGRQAVKVNRTWIMRSANNGITSNGADAGYDTVLIGLSGANAIYIGGWVQHLSNCDIWSSGANGIVCDNVSMVSLTNCGIDRHQQAGLVVQGGGTVNTSGCVFHSNSQAGNGSHPHISVTAGQLTMTGSQFGYDSLANNPDYAIKCTGGTVSERGSIASSGAYVTGFINDPTKLVPDSPVWQPSDMGLISWTHDPMAAAGSAASASGTIYFMKVAVRRRTAITNVLVTVTGAGSGLTAGQNLVGLYNAAGTKLAESADQSTAFTTTGPKTIPLATPQMVAPGHYYVAVMSNGTTPASLMYTTAQNAAALNLGGSLRFLNITGQTSLPASFTPGSAGTGTNARWAAIS